MLWFTLACAIFNTPCEELILEICDQCPLDDYSEVTCTCIQEGNVTPNDYPEGTDITKDEAEFLCASTRAHFNHLSDDARESCEADLQLMRDFPVLTCESLGYVEPTPTPTE